MLLYNLDENFEPVEVSALNSEDWGSRWQLVHHGLHKGLPVTVSTVFLVFDHSRLLNEDPAHVPILFETAIFGGLYDGYVARYATYEEALAGHRDALYLVGIDVEVADERDRFSYSPSKRGIKL